MVTIRKLAELAGVSHVTVWCALHNQPGVSPEVRARIVALAEEQHYRPNRLVEGLITGKTRTVGLIVGNVTWDFCSRICFGVMNEAFQDRVNVITLNLFTGKSPDYQLPLLIDQLIEQRVDGIIISADIFVPTPSLLAMWSHDIVPVLNCNTPGDKPLDRIATDERRLAQLAVDYLLRQGHQRIAYCGYMKDHPRNQEMHHAFQTRKLSLDLFNEDAGQLVAPAPWHGERYLDFFLQQPHPPTAVICFEDHMATQLLLHAERRGLRVPGDLSILGCGNNNLCGYLTPALTSIEQFPEEIGARAYELIQRRRNEGTNPGERKPEMIQILPKLVIRASCGPPRRSNAPILPAAEFAASRQDIDTTAQVNAQVTRELLRLLAAGDDTQSQQQLMAHLGLRHREHFRKTYLAPALASGYVEWTIPDKPRSCRQRYRLTEKGRAWVVNGEQ